MKAPLPTDPPIESSTAPVETPPVPPSERPPATPPNVKLAAWPQWVKSVDAFLAFLTLILAFVVGSYIARNSDLWLHLASGRGLLNGTYTFGSDPFSHATGDRVWVNHSWLAGLIMYVMYNADTTGFVLVAVKAFLFAASFAVVFLLRRPGQTLWPWILLTATGIVAAAPHTGLRPFVLSGLFLAITLYILLAREWKPGVRWPMIALGVVFWLWASCDNWFVLGPLAVLSVLVGECIQKLIGRGEADSGMPTIRQLAFALVVGIVAASLTPHHVRVWQLPVELGLSLPANAATDSDTRVISFTPMNQNLYLRLSGPYWNFNGWAYLGLFLGGGAILALGIARLRAAHLILWLVFGGLSVVHFRLILPFAIVAVPLAASALCGLIDRIQLGAADGPRAKLLVLLSSVGRLIAVPVVLLLLAAAYPGELHPRPGHPSMIQRCAWGIEADPGLKRTAEMLQEWRESGKLPDDYLGMVINFDLANHIAWFAPKEKVFVNSRFGHHLPELEELIKARRIFIDRQPNEPIEVVEITYFREFCQQHGINYVVYSGKTIPPARRIDSGPLYQLSSYAGNYTLWHADGRAIILGDLRSKLFRLDTYRQLAFNPIRLAFHPDLVQSLPTPPDGTRKQKFEPTILDPFVLDPPKPPPLESLDAHLWNELATQRGELDYYQQTILWPQVAGALGNPYLARVAQETTYHADDITTAYRFLALRAAYTAIAKNPDHPDAYLVIAQSGGFGRGPDGTGAPTSIPGLSNETKQQLEISGLRQFLDRTPPPDKANSLESGLGYYASFWLHELYQPQIATANGQAVLPEPAAEMLSLASKYLPRTEMAIRNNKEAEKKLKELKDQLNAIEVLVGRFNDRYIKLKTTELPRQIAEAIQLRLFSQAKAKFNEGWPELLGPETIRLTLDMVRVYMQLGELDEADYFLREVDNGFAMLAEAGRPRQQPWDGLYRNANELRFELWQLRGDFGRAGEALERSLEQLLLKESEREYARRASSQRTSEDFTRLLFPPPHLMAVTGGPWVVEHLEGRRSVDKWLEQSNFFLRRGILLLLEGKPAEARFRFQQSLRPDKLDLPSYLPQRAIAEQYIRILDAAMK